MMPLSYQGFGFTGIILMVLVLAAGQLVTHLKERYHKKHPKEVKLPASAFKKQVRGNPVGK